MGYYRRSSIFDSFSLSPLPYPVLLLLALPLIFLGISSYFSYEEALETAEEQLSWVLFATPVLLILLVRWLSSMEYSDMYFTSSSPWDKRRRTHYQPSELLLVLVQFQSSFLDSWF
ncbi:hypothetical protein Pint_34389 [Pistacia integerrima]|uniref:Uncharacterized protein n=2 Tax=Pistacia integerrima TaxID=434235 RepID=A0ACC0X7G3_9ROSI|nr:hypothetical protein Pint_34386 [Pistacia integerrima]KAJ0011230.1 hypothetical protein Pint_34389 [Pistacia integerrima]KAJ0077111.1 hypothetical protein Patl1_36108 [Pistacia atlantica]